MNAAKLLPGKFVWFEHASRDAKKAQAFYGEVFGWKVSSFPISEGSYDMIAAGDAMIGGYDVRRVREGEPAHWRSVMSVANVDATAKAAAGAGGKLIDAPADMPQVGRFARIADPLGAELSLLTSFTDDPPDAIATHGRWLWNELHTGDPARSVAFCEKVLGYSVRAQDMGPAGTYPLAISHLTKGTRTLYLSVSGAPARPITVTGKSTTIPATTTVSVTLNAGPNTLRFSNDTAAAPDLDRVVVP